MFTTARNNDSHIQLILIRWEATRREKCATKQDSNTDKQQLCAQQTPLIPRCVHERARTCVLHHVGQARVNSSVTTTNTDTKRCRGTTEHTLAYTNVTICDTITVWH